MTSKSDRLVINQSKDFKKIIIKTIKNSSYNLENTHLKDNYRYFEKVYLELIAFYLRCDEELTFKDFLDEHKDAIFIFNSGFRASSFKVRNNFDIYINKIGNNEVNYFITFESWSGRIIKSNIKIPEHIYDVFMLNMYLTNHPDFKNEYDWTQLDRVIETHFIDQKIGDQFILSAMTYLSKIDKNISTKLVNDWGIYKKNIADKQLDDYEAFQEELAKKKEEEIKTLKLEKKD